MRPFVLTLVGIALAALGCGPADVSRDRDSASAVPPDSVPGVVPQPARTASLMFPDAPTLAALADAARHDVEHCGSDSTFRHASPENMIDTLLQHLRVGAFQGLDEFLASATLCPDLEQGADVFDVLDSTRFVLLPQLPDTMRAVLLSRQVARNYLDYFEDSIVSRSDTMLLVRSRSGWRIVRPYWTWMDVEAARQRGFRTNP